MSDYFRPSFDGDYKKKIEEFLERNPEIPFENAKEFMKFCTDQTMIEIETNKQQLQDEQERIKEELKESLEDL